MEVADSRSIAAMKNLLSLAGTGYCSIQNIEYVQNIEFG